MAVAMYTKSCTKSANFLCTRSQFCRWLAVVLLVYIVSGLAETPYCRKFVSTCRGGPHPWRCTGGRIRGVIHI